MKKEDLLKILGKPKNIQIDSSDNNKEYFYYSSFSLEASSEVPTVLFDSGGVVLFSTYGSGD